MKIVGTLTATCALAWASAAFAEFKSIEGTASYRERVALLRDSVLEVELRDISRADAAAPLLSFISVKPNGQVPIPFKLLYDDTLIEPRHAYAVSAKIRAGKTVVFRTTKVHPVLTRGNPDRVDIVMERMPAENKESALGLYGPTWRAEAIGGRGVVDNALTTITFAADGDVSGSGGCNTFRGKAKADGERITIGPLAATRKSCAPALMDQEQKFFDSLGEVRAFEIDKVTRKMILKDDAGTKLIQLTEL